MTVRDAARIILVVAVFVTLQQTVLLNLHVAGIHPDIMVLLPVAAGLVGGPSQGALMGFGTGLVADLFLPTPFGLSALIGCLVGFAVGMATAAVDRSVFWLPPLTALGASVVYELAFAAVGSILGQPQMLHVNLVGIVLVVSIANALVAVPAVRSVAWALPKVSTEGMPGGLGAAGMPR